MTIPYRRIYVKNNVFELNTTWGNMYVSNGLYE
jgi:hypothetical protein